MVLGKCKYGMNVNWSLLQQVKVSLLSALFIISPLIILVRGQTLRKDVTGHMPQRTTCQAQSRSGKERKEEASWVWSGRPHHPFFSGVPIGMRGHRAIPEMLPDVFMRWLWPVWFWVKLSRQKLATSSSLQSCQLWTQDALMSLWLCSVLGV